MPALVRHSTMLIAVGTWALGACADRTPLGTTEPVTAPPNSQELECRVDVRAKSMKCGPVGLAGPNGTQSAVIIGGQGQYVQLTGSNVNYNGGTGQFTTNVTIQNLIPQPLGTMDGTTPAPNGIRVFFHSGPSVVTGTGVVSVVPDGFATFTAAGQPYYQYSGPTLGADGILSQNETSSAKTWTLVAPPTVNTFSFLILVSADVPFPSGYIDVTPGTDQLAATETQGFVGTVRTFVGNTIPGQTVTWGTTDNGIATIDAAGVLTGVAPGTVTVTATSGARSGSAAVDVCPNLALGAAHTFTMPAGARFCLAGGSGREYTVVTAYAAATGSSIPLTVTGSSIIPVGGGPPSPYALNAPLSRAFGSTTTAYRDHMFELRLHERSRELERLIPRARRSLAEQVSAQPITPGVPAVGALMNLNVASSDACATNDIRTGRVVAVGTRIIILADTTNPAGLSNAEYQEVADSFDVSVHPTLTGAFGAPADIDGNGRVIAFYTRAVNELTPPANPSYIGGFVFARDLFPDELCPTSNEGELFYMLAADPTGTVNGNVRSVALIKSLTVGVLAHEFQHLINASRRMYINGASEFEEVWLDEGLAHIAEELMFYRQTGLTAGSNLGIAQIGDGGVVQNNFFSFAESNFGRLRQWLVNPIASGPFQSDDDLATRGAIWAYLRYVKDQNPGASFFDLVNTTSKGIANLDAELGGAGSALNQYTNFVAAMYADDAGLGAPAALTQPSWNFRQIYSALDYNPGPGCSCAYELAVRNPSNGVADNYSIVSGGGAGYVRIGVPASGFATVTIQDTGAPPGASVRVVVIRRK